MRTLLTTRYLKNVILVPRAATTYFILQQRNRSRLLSLRRINSESAQNDWEVLESRTFKEPARGRYFLLFLLLTRSNAAPGNENAINVRYILKKMHL